MRRKGPGGEDTGMSAIMLMLFVGVLGEVEWGLSYMPIFNYSYILFEIHVYLNDSVNLLLCHSRMRLISVVFGKRLILFGC